MYNVYIAAAEIISPLGISLQKHMEGVYKGTSGSARIRRFDASSFSTTFGCEVKDDLSLLYKNINPDIKAIFPYDRKLELFACCFELFLDKISYIREKLDKSALGVFVGTGTETLSGDHIDEYRTLLMNNNLDLFAERNKGLKHINRIVNPSHIVTHYASSFFPSTCIRQTNLSACAASSQAIGNACEAIKNGRCATAIVGGVDSTINPFVFTAFTQLGMLSGRNESPETASRPFDVYRDGFVPGEGAGLILLVNDDYVPFVQSLIALVKGYGSSLDAYKLTAPHPEGLGAELSMQRCLASARWSPDSIEYINAHGTSTPLNDFIESKALEKVFTNKLKDIFVSSTKSQIGHLIAAGGIVECITTVSAMHEGYLPPSINVINQDKKCKLNVVTEAGVQRPVKRALSNSFALGGQNSTLALERL